MRRVGAAILLAVVGCGGSPPAAPAPSPTPSAEATARSAPPTDAELVQGVLDRRAAALNRRRLRAYASTAASRDRAADRLAARRLRSLGVHDLTLQAEDVEVTGGRATVRVRLGYRVSGVPGRFGGIRTMTARSTRDGWRVDRVAGARRRAPWEVDDYGEVVSPHFVVWTPVGVDATALTASLEEGYARMAEILRRGRLRRRYLVVVARDAAAARRLTGSIQGLEGLVALTDTEVRQRGPEARVVRVDSQRLVVIAPSFSGLDPDARRIAVTHELAHAALAPVTSGRTPGWLTEGLAMYVSGDDRTSEAGTLGPLPLRRLARPGAFGRLSGDEQRRAYATASAAAFAIARRFGRARLIRLYLAFNDPDLTGEAGDPALVAAAVRRVLGTRLGALQP